MSFWYTLLGIIFVLCALIRAKNFNKKKNTVFFIVIVAILCFFAGIRTNIGDTNTYLRYIRDTPSSFHVFFSTLDFSTEFGFKILMFFLKKIFFGNSQLVLAFFSTVTIIITLLMYKKSVKNYDLAVYVFITSAIYMTIMNGVRQYFVAGLFFLTLPLVKDKKFIKYVFVILLLATIHKSALLLIPVYFVLNIRPWSKKSWLFIFVILLAFLLFPIYGNYLANYLISNDVYASYAREFMDSQNGSNIIRFVVALVPVVMSYFCKNDLIENEPYYSIVFNCSLLNAAFYLFGVKHYIFARFIFYFSPISIILLCWSIQYLKNRNVKFFATALCLLFYLAYYYYQISVVWNTPYTTVFN